MRRLAVRKLTRVSFNTSLSLFWMLGNLAHKAGGKIFNPGRHHSTLLASFSQCGTCMMLIHSKSNGYALNSTYNESMISSHFWTSTLCVGNFQQMIFCTITSLESGGSKFWVGFFAHPDWKALRPACLQYINSMHESMCSNDKL